MMSTLDRYIGISIAKGFLLVACVFIAGCRGERDPELTEPRRTYFGKLSEMAVDGWETCRLDSDNGGVVPIDARDILVITKGMTTATGDRLEVTFEFEGSNFTVEMPAMENVAWKPLLVSEPPKGDDHKPPFVVILKKVDNAK